MKRIATAFLVLVGLTFASAVFAVDFTTRTPLPSGTESATGLAAVYVCDNGTLNSAFFQDDGGRYGNLFNFPANSLLSSVEFVHFGYNTLFGPYSYDLEMWDLASCTPVAFINGLSAADAYSAPQIEQENLCAYGVLLSGNVIVAVDANSCFDPTDCYPDVMFDDNYGASCPYVVDATALQCFSQMGNSGAFLLRVETDNCPVPAKKDSWGSVKQIYR